MPAGRPKKNYETLLARLPEGTAARVKAAIREGEAQNDVLKAAILNELDRREREKR